MRDVALAGARWRWARLCAPAAVLLIWFFPLGGGSARAALRGPAVPPPKGCQPVTIAQAEQAGGSVCIHRVLVTETWNAEANDSTFTVTDHVSTLTATFRNWWPQGPPTAGMVITLWAHLDAGQWVVDRWIDLTHGTGPAPAGPYPAVRLLDASSGMEPVNRPVWVPAIPFLLDPQDSGDGDIHVQTFWPCPAAGLTTEATPPLRGYVDHPALPGLTSSTDTADPPHNHLADAPPVGVPVLILGDVRFDYGFGWFEVHPIRAWRPMTAAEIAAASQQCAQDPVPHLGPGPTIGGVSVPVPFGVPPCTDGSEFGNPPGFTLCHGPQCYVAHTAIGQYETLAGNCQIGVKPERTPSQESLPERLPGQGLAAVPASVLTRARSAGAGVERDERNDSVRTLAAAVTRAYGEFCRRAGVRGAAAEAKCAAALAHLVMEPISPARACSGQARGRQPACRRAGGLLLRRLRGASGTRAS